MTFLNDISLNTLFISGVVAITGLALRGAVWGLAEICKTLIVKLIETMSRVDLLDQKFKDLLEVIGDVQKIRYDLNGFYSRLKKLEDKFDS